MAAFGDGFELSKWYNKTASKHEASASDTTDVEDVDAAVVAEEAVPIPLHVESTYCHVCHAPNPEYLSTNTVKGAPSVPVCSLECESEYLKQKGWQANNKSGGKYVDLTTATSNDVTTSAKKSKRKETVAEDAPEEDRTSKRPRRSFSFLDDHMLESEESNGYKSWWLGAMAFYDFVYQRHGMWHSYTMSNNEPHVDPALIKYWTCNTYRELDRSTAYLRKYALRWQQAHQGRLSLREVLWMAVVFRYCNKLETFDKANGIPSSDGFVAFKKRLTTMSKRKEGNALFAGRRDLDVTRYLEVLEEFLENIDSCTFDVMKCTRTYEVFEELRKFRNNALGSFTCWQVVCDLVELNMFGEDFDAEDFVWLSLDAKKSLVQIFGKRRARPPEYVSLAKLLQQRQTQGFKALGVRFPYFMSQKLSLKNIGHSLHGFQVYRNIKLLQQSQFHKHEPGTTTPVVYSSRSYLMDSESCEICSLAENEDEQVLCDTCNRLFHLECVNMTELPPASWVCTACKKLVNLPEEGAISGPDVISID
ncbi:hypothetical protein Poli38472_002325 [Pythium oligandrum]|uniref:PHD-type domain-containing protein n=1 Tax=Pythium oligandrum TaxID=41045 RepID=A0A8K1CH00_PYTOL|nr:hypothetical protein Poli38472_002325 [Pythium oligandrum]|eukprot:TMW63384.1 hypothetical protein Poli38472_002325 [Pythium oligandrum]